ncbi:hypothetical protein JOC94_002920 [Bacillus thermophilus]|uniref:Uncharacterized protein n=1 Tax=Siminovitchia thermophila TaxID=1245522 RepID=A0ABS2R9Q7_9BACI|nr:hypothetical protein [Siminovitchia thermophila]MBM7715909.1 hypothetical protein [Siminovitchia thermophila]
MNKATNNVPIHAPLFPDPFNPIHVKIIYRYLRLQKQMNPKSNASYLIHPLNM